MKDKSRPAITFFPEFETLYNMISNEIAGLTEEELDYISEDWAWASWSIRNQISHMEMKLYFDEIF